MAPERWERVEALFQEALEQPPSQRAAWLARTCAQDGDLEREVGALLQADREALGFLDTPLIEALGPVDPAAGESVGRYRLLRRLGEGGISVVYLAVRDDAQYRKRVALKLVKRGMDTEGVLRRFNRERQILASLDHPGIAGLLDGGSTADGRPYFVLEHVDGLEITEYCRRRGLGVPERLELFRGVCSAVHYAHRNLVVHRDIKPSNILVSEGGQPKLLDFGIAKLLNPELCSEAAEMTSEAVRLMTPRYASPEQVRGGPITTATDVYSLGVLLYRLLTGRHPWEGQAPGEVESAIVRAEPDRPSAACARGEEARAFARKLRGDLDNVVLKAMAKEPEQRYASAHELSEDLRRYLEGQPVGARPPTFAYRAGKFVRRNRMAVAAATLVVASLLGGIVTTTWQARVAEARRAEAETQRARAEAVSAFVVDLFRVSDPGEARGGSVTAREILERGSRRIVEGLEGQPEVRATLMATMGAVYSNLGLYQRAEPLLEAALVLRREVLGRDHPHVARSLAELGSLRKLLGDEAGAEALNREALALRRRLLDPTHPEVADSLVQLAEVLNSETSADEAEALLREALALREAALGEEHPAVADVVMGLAIMRQAKGDYDGAERLCRDALAIRRRSQSADHPDVIVTLQNLGTILLSKGQAAEAEPLYREALTAARAVLGPEHQTVGVILYNLADARLLQGDAREAEALHRESLLLRRRALGPQHSDVPGSLHGLAAALQAQGRIREAEALHREALLMRRTALGPDHPAVATSQERVGAVLRDEGDLVEAEGLFGRSLALRRRQLPASHPLLARSLIGLGSVLLSRGAAREAEPLFREALEIVQRSLPPDHWRAAEARAALGVCLEAQGRAGEAEALLAPSRPVLRSRTGPHRTDTRWLRDRLGGAP